MEEAQEEDSGGGGVMGRSVRWARSGSQAVGPVMEGGG